MISVASSIKFRKEDGLLPSFDNTLFEDETHFRIAKHPFMQTFFTTDTAVKVQAEVETGQLFNLQYAIGTLKSPGVMIWGEFSSMSGESKVYSGVYDYWEIELNMSDYTYVKFRGVITENESVVETWISEPVQVIAADTRYLLIEFFNLEDKFHCYYTNPTEADRITHRIRVKGVFRKYKSGGETSVFDNQDEIVKIKDEVKRMLTLETEPIPAYLAEMITVATAHDKFFINEVEFVAENKPEYETGGGDLASLTCTLTQRNVIGLNTHDIGLNCNSISDTYTMVLQEENASGQKSFTVPEGYLIATITGYRTAGNPVIIAGTTPGGNEILYGMNLSSGTPLEVATVNTEIANTGDQTLYAEVTGTGATANIYVLLIKNRQ